MKRSLNTQVSSVLRIVRGERDALVRTTHFKATVENVSNVTIERKIMSTKTTFKRVALVAVAAVGLGLLSAVPSNAAAGTFTNGSIGLGTSGSATVAQTQAIGGQASVVLLLDTPTAGDRVTNVTVSGVGTMLSSSLSGATRLYAASTTAAINGVTNWSDSSSATTPSQTDTILVTSSVVGTTTITATPLDASGTALTPVTKTITWTSVAASTVVNHSTAFIGAATSPWADGTIVVSKTTTGSVVGYINVNEYLTADTSTVVTAGNSSAVSVAIAGGIGAVATQAAGFTAAGPSASIAAGSFTSTTGAAGAVNGNQFYVYANGVSGTGTITVSVGGVAIATKTITFIGSAVSYTATGAKGTIAADSAATTAAVIAVVAKDSLGNVVPSQSLTVTSSDPTIVASTTATSSDAASATAGTATIGVTSIAGKFGKVTLTFSDASATIAATATAVVTLASATPETVSIAFDKASYAPGEKMVLTVSGVTAAGTATANQAVSGLLSALSANASVQGFPADLTATTTDGSKAYTMYAPLLAGDVVVTATDVTTAANTLTATATVSGGDAAAALDAANEATDAANYAADAADAATTAAEEATAAANAAGDAATAAQASADAALAAVTDLGLKVTGLISALRAQITSLTNLIVKIQKKVNA